MDVFGNRFHKASNIDYDNDTSGLTAIDVQAALDELVVTGASYVNKPSIVPVVDDSICRFDGETGLIIQESAGVNIDNSATMGGLYATNYVGNVGPFNPPAGSLKVYADTSDNLRILNSSGVDTIIGGAVLASDVTALSAGGATFNNVQDMQNIYHSSGYTNGGVITDNLDGTINVLAGEGFLRDVATATADCYFIAWPTSLSVALTDTTLNYICVEWNAGTPQVVVSLTEPDHLTTFQLANIYRNGTTLHITIQSVFQVGDHVRHMIERLQGLSFFSRESGMIITETGTRNIALTAGVTWCGLTSFNTGAIDTSVADTFTYFYNAASYVSVIGQTQIDNLQYDNAGTLATLNNNEYGVHFVYYSVDNELSIVYGTDSYTLTDATNTTAPAITPARFQKHAFLIGKIIIKKSAATFTDIISNFTDPITTGGAPVNVVNGTGTDNAIVRFDTNGNTLQNSIVGIDDSGHVIPDTDNAQDLGTTALRYRSLYATDVEVGAVGGVVANISADRLDLNDTGDIVTLSTGGSGLLNITSGMTHIDITKNAVEIMRFSDTAITAYENLNPSTDSTFDLGLTGTRWKDLYIDSVVSTSQVLASKPAGLNTIVIDDSGTTRSSLTTAIDTTIIGRNAGTLTNASNCIFIGVSSGQYQTGINNIAIGINALQGHITNPCTGTVNTAFGISSLKICETGEYNSCFGNLAGDAIVSGVRNTCLGFGTDVGTASDGYAVAIGASAVSADSSIAIGRGAIALVKECVLGGVGVYIDKIISKATTKTVDLGSSSYEWKDIYTLNAVTVSSDPTLKNIDLEFNYGLDYLTKLKPISYKWKDGVRTHLGFDAAVIEKQIESKEIPDSGLFIKPQPYMRKYYKTALDVDGNEEQVVDREELYTPTLRLRPMELIAPLVKAIQELNNRLKILESKVII